MVSTKERFDYTTASKEGYQRALKQVLEMREREEALKKLTPPCPDGSGRIGKYDPEASDFFGLVYSTDDPWPDKVYFHWNARTNRGKIIPERSIPKHLKK